MDDGPAVERVRADLARLGGDEASAPDVPSAVTDRVVSALRTARPVRSIRRRRIVRASAAAGALAAVVAAVLGVVNLAGSDTSTRAGSSQENIGAPDPTIPLPEDEILALLRTPPDLGPLSDPRRRASCLSGLGYPGSTAVLGARQFTMAGQPAVLLLLAGETPTAGTQTQVVALAVSANCNAADTGLLAETQIRRP
jgi:hypothetical protein